eukprot:494074_1
MTLLVLLIVLLQFTNGFLRCKNGHGDPTDWWFALRNEGLRTFEYFDSRLEASGMSQFDSFSFTDPHNPIKHLLEPIRVEANNRYSRALGISRVPPIQAPTTGYIAYNDQSSKVSGANAHAKGFIAWELDGAHQWKGYWLIHSQPYWP